MVQISEKERVPFQSVLFSVTECLAALTALGEINKLHAQVCEMNSLERENLILSPETIVTLVGTARDYFCIRIANLFDKRKDVHSLKKYFHGDVIGILEKHPITVAAIGARHNNIAHMGKAYTKWPDIDTVLAATDLRELLKVVETDLSISIK